MKVSLNNSHILIHIFGAVKKWFRGNLKQNKRLVKSYIHTVSLVN